MKKAMIYCLLACGIMLGTVSLGNIANNNEERDVYTSYMDEQTKIRDEQVPKLIAGKQISSNQIEITYNKDVDNKLATMPMNYWVRSTTEVNPTGISTLGKNDKISPENSLADDKVKIEPVNGSKRVYILTFNNSITKDEEFQLYICNMTMPKAPAYSGDNGSVVLVGQ